MKRLAAAFLDGFLGFLPLTIGFLSVGTTNNTLGDFLSHVLVGIFTCVALLFFTWPRSIMKKLYKPETIGTFFSDIVGFIVACIPFIYYKNNLSSEKIGIHFGGFAIGLLGPLLLVTLFRRISKNKKVTSY